MRALPQEDADSPIRFSTVDAFQGNEKDVIILSTVRSKSIGFSADPCRLNVAITRARSQLIIVGNRELLERDNLWKRVLAYIAKNGPLPRFCFGKDVACLFSKHGLFFCHSETQAEIPLKDDFHHDDPHHEESRNQVCSSKHDGENLHCE